MLSVKLHGEVARAAAKHYQLKSEEVELEVTRDLAHGDFSTNVALKVASKWGVPPHEAAKTILAELSLAKGVHSVCTNVEVAGPGFINFKVKPEVWLKHLPELTNPKARAVYRGQRIVVEYSSPNIAKPMHIGHIRSTIIGSALANLYENLGAKVVRINHLGDWGTQFGKLIAAYKLWGNRAAVHKHPIEEMLKLYVRFHEEMKERPELEKQGQEEFNQLERGDRRNRVLWNWFKRESLREFNALYKQLGISFTYITGESFYEPLLKGVVADFVKRKIATRNADGSIVVHLEAESLPPALIQKSDGASLYLTRDLATIRYRVKRFKPHAVLYVVANEQALHFEQLFACARLAGYTGATGFKHIKFGLVLGSDGQKLATREGKTIPLSQVLREARDLARKVVEAKNSKLPTKLKLRVAEVVGIGAVKYNDLSQNRHTDITFNWEKMLSLEGNSAPYLLYTYVRLRSILRKFAKAQGKLPKLRLPKFTPAILHHAGQGDITLLRLLARYPEALARAARENGPHLLAAYLYELANATNSYYHESPVLSAPQAVRPLRLALVSIGAEVLKQGLGILGLEVVEQM